MRDGRTRRVKGTTSSGANSAFLARQRASLTIVRGPAAGSEVELGATRLLIDRSANAGLSIEDRSVSREHASIELDTKGFGVRDLASTNGVRVNGAIVESANLKHGDRIQIGDCELQYVLEERRDAASGRLWQLGDRKLGGGKRGGAGRSKH